MAEDSVSDHPMTDVSQAPTTVPDADTLDRLEMKVLNSPYRWESHIEYVTALRSAQEWERCHKARQAMSDVFPLSEELWLQWLTDLKIYSSDPEEVTALFEKAVQDFMSVPLWCLYCDHEQERLKDILSDPEATRSGSNAKEWKHIRDLYERGLSSVGLHLSQGHSLWAAYFDCERRLQDLLLDCDADDTTIAEQTERYNKLQRRYLSVPVIGTSEIYSEWKEDQQDVEDQSYVKQTEAAYHAAQEMIIARAELEARVKAASSFNARYAVWREYIDLERKTKDPSRIICIYERALVTLFKHPLLWIEYTEYLNTIDKDRGLATIVRVCRSCYNSGRVWATRMRTLERVGKTHEDIVQAYTSALSASIKDGVDFVEAVFAYAAYQRRLILSSPNDTTTTTTTGTTENAGSTTKVPALTYENIAPLRAIYQPALELCKQYYPGPAVVLLGTHWARLEAAVYNKDTVTMIFGQVLEHVHHDPAVLREYALLDRLTGNDGSGPRAVYRRLAKKGPGSNATVKGERAWAQCVEDWYIFEHDVGTLDSIQEATAAVHAARERMDKKGKGGGDGGAAPRGPKGKGTGFDKGHGQGDKGRGKRGRESEGKHPAAAATTAPPATTTGADGGDDERAAKRARAHEPGASSETPQQAQRPRSTSDASHGSGVGGGSTGSKREREYRDDGTTIFVLNLPYKITADHIDLAFGEFGRIKDTRIPRRRDGSAKGLAYIEYEKPEEAQKALAMDGKSVGGRPVQVSISKHQSKEKHDQYLHDKKSNRAAAKSGVGYAPGILRAAPPAPRAASLDLSSFSLVPTVVKRRPGLGSNPAAAKTGKGKGKGAVGDQGQAGESVSTNSKPTVGKSNADFAALFKKK